MIVICTGTMHVASSHNGHREAPVSVLAAGDRFVLPGALADGAAAPSWAPTSPCAS